MKNLEIAAILYGIADILELQGVDFKPQAYRKAARSIEALSEDIAETYEQGKLHEIPGVGESIAQKIEEIISTGKLQYYEQLKKKVKVNIEELHQIPTLGPKKIKILSQKLGIKNIHDLEKAVKAHKLVNMSGFGEESEKNILHGIEIFKNKPTRFLYFQARPIVQDITTRLRSCPFIQKVEVAGSFRRGKETVGDVDFVVISDEPEKVMEKCVSLPDVREIIARGEKKTSLRLSNAMQVDLRVFSAKEFGSAMNYFIGNKEHNVELRKIALKKGFTLSEYGLFTLKGKKWVAGRTEAEIYVKLGMEYIEPELRENRGEIKAALGHTLPDLVQLKDIKGVFHNHSLWSDGSSSLLGMAQKAEDVGFKFISFNDHFGNVGITHPLNEKRLLKYLQEIEKVRKKVNVCVFSGVEIDILKDGSLPLSVKKLRELDVVIASVHLGLKMSEAEMTTRVCSALENYPITILGHPTDRLLNVREPLSLNLEKVFSVAQRRNTFLEINSSPFRLDLSGEQIKSALEQGCKVALSTDAHSPPELSHYNYGVMMARRGWAEKKDILNCWDLKKIEKALQK